jgi:hypothetical protein
MNSVAGLSIQAGWFRSSLLGLNVYEQSDNTYAISPA